MPLVDVAAAQAHIRQAHEDRIAAMESALGSRRKRITEASGNAERACGEPPPRYVGI